MRCLFFKGTISHFFKYISMICSYLEIYNSSAVLSFVFWVTSCDAWAFSWLCIQHLILEVLSGMLGSKQHEPLSRLVFYSLYYHSNLHFEVSLELLFLIIFSPISAPIISVLHSNSKSLSKFCNFYCCLCFDCLNFHIGVRISIIYLYLSDMFCLTGSL